jgi:pyruvate dehydrogenase E1 component beta subunit
MVMECLRAHELLAEAGIQAEVIDPVSLVPLDIDTIIESVNRTGRLLVVDNAWTNCGASAEILARVSESPAALRGIQMSRMGFAPTTCPPSPPIEREFYPNPLTISARVHEMVRPDDARWAPDQERAELAYQLQFRGPF